MRPHAAAACKGSAWTGTVMGNGTTAEGPDAGNFTGPTQDRASDKVQAAQSAVAHSL